MHGYIFELSKEPIHEDDRRTASSINEIEYNKNLDAVEDVNEVERNRAIDSLLAEFSPHVERFGDRLVFKESIREYVFEHAYRRFCKTLQELVDKATFNRFCGREDVEGMAFESLARLLSDSMKDGIGSEIRILDDAQSECESLTFPEWLRNMDTVGSDETDRYNGGAVYYVGGVIDYHL